MATRVTRGKGRIYQAYSEGLVARVSYLIQEELTEEGSPRRWWGELIPIDNVHILDSDRYVLELEDKRQGRCSLRRRINKAVVLVPPRFFYLIIGIGLLK